MESSNQTFAVNAPSSVALDQPLRNDSPFAPRTTAISQLRATARAALADERRTLRSWVADPAVRASAVLEAIDKRCRSYQHRLSGLLPRLESARIDDRARDAERLDRPEEDPNPLLNAIDSGPYGYGASDWTRDQLRRSVTNVAAVGGVRATLRAASDHVFLDRLRTLRAVARSAGRRRFAWGVASHLVRLVWGLAIALLAAKTSVDGTALLVGMLASYAVLEGIAQPAIRAAADRDDRRILPDAIDRFYGEALITQRSMDLADEFIDDVRRDEIVVS